ncbi:TonB-dependent receptor [Hyphobacterium sp. CCMP332]|nr:TonB-dependent receptor [Hyphobacterium sp. CCMP332]
MLRHKAFLALMLLYSHWLYAQTLTLEGLVQSSDGEALPGALLHLHEPDINIASDNAGRFSFNNLKPGYYHLHVNFIGFQEQILDIDLNESLYLKIELKEAYKELDEVVVESSFMNSDVADASQSIQNVNKERLIKSGGGSFVNSLEEIPGISAINTGVGIAKPVIRGMSFNRVLVNDNGIKQEGQQWGSDHGLEIDQFNVGRVEIVKGPATLMYGSDALGGAINILPNRIPASGEVTGEIRGLYRSNNAAYGTSFMVEGAKNSIYARARFSTLDFADYRVPASEFVYNTYRLNIENERLKNTAGRERNSALTLGLRKSWGSANITYTRFDQKAGLFAGAVGIPRAYDLNDDGDIRNIDLPRQQTVHDKIVLNSLVKLGNNWLETQMGYQNNHREERTLPHAHGVGPVPEGNLALNLNLQTFTFNSRLRRRVNGKTKDVYGISAQYQLNKESGYEHLLSPFTALQTGIYAMRQYELSPSFILSGGLRLDYGEIKIEEFFSPVWINAESVDYYSQRNPEIDKSFFNYSASAGFSWFPDPDLNLKVNLGRSFRIPTAAELSINGVHHGTFRHELGNKDLNSEIGYQADLGIVYNKKTIQFSFSPYLNYFRDYIYLSPTSSFGYTDQTGNLVLLPEAGQTFQYKQNNALITGFEVLADYHFVSHWHVELGTEYVYKYNLDTEIPLPFTPPPSIHLGMDYDWKWQKTSFSIGGNVKNYFDQNNVDRNEMPTPGFQLFGLSANINRKIGKNSISLYTQVRNLFDRKYFNHLSRYRLLNLPEQGRDIIINLLYNF